MKIKTIVAAILAAGVASAAGVAPSAAQTSAAQPSPIATGPALPGVCSLNSDEMIAMSLVGNSVVARLNQLQAVVAGQLKAEDTSLQTDGTALAAQRSTLSSDQFSQKAAQIEIRQRNLQREADQRQHEMQATQDKQVRIIYQQADPIIRQLVTERNCSLVLDARALVVGNPAMDLTPTLVQRLDGKDIQNPDVRP